MPCHVTRVGVELYSMPKITALPPAFVPFPNIGNEQILYLDQDIQIPLPNTELPLSTDMAALPNQNIPFNNRILVPEQEFPLPGFCQTNPMLLGGELMPETEHMCSGNSRMLQNEQVTFGDLSRISNPCEMSQEEQAMFDENQSERWMEFLQGGIGQRNQALSVDILENEVTKHFSNVHQTPVWTFA